MPNIIIRRSRASRVRKWLVSANSRTDSYRGHPVTASPIVAPAGPHTRTMAFYRAVALAVALLAAAVGVASAQTPTISALGCNQTTGFCTTIDTSLTVQGS